MWRSFGNFHSVSSMTRQSPRKKTVSASRIIRSKLLEFLICVDVNQLNIKVIKFIELEISDEPDFVLTNLHRT